MSEFEGFPDCAKCGHPAVEQRVSDEEVKKLAVWCEDVYSFNKSANWRDKGLALRELLQYRAQSAAAAEEKPKESESDMCFCGYPRMDHFNQPWSNCYCEHFTLAAPAAAVEEEKSKCKVCLHAQSEHDEFGCKFQEDGPYCCRCEIPHGGTK